MPLIPFEPRPTVAPTGGVGAFQSINASPESFGASVARGQERLGAAVQEGGNVAANAAINFQKQQNETDVDAANVEYDSKRREMLFSENGFYSKKGKDAYDSMTPTTTAIEEMRKEYQAKLTNPEQIRMFDSISRRATQMDLRSMSMHAATENQNYRVGVAKSSITNEVNESGAYWNDPYRFALSLGKIKGYAENAARLEGRTDPEQIKADVNHYTTQAWAARIQSAMVKDPVTAQDMYRANEDQIGDLATKVHLEHQLTSAVRPVLARRAAEQVIRGANLPNLAPVLEAAGEPLVNAVISQESGGNTAAVSPKGALGVMHLMPDTARGVAAELGVPYDKDRLTADPAYNKALGTKYLQNMLARYGGNQTLALAAYNAGPNAVDRWIKTNGDPNSGAISDAEFAAKIPYAETRDYVSRISSKVGGQQAGVPATKTDTRAHLASWVANAETVAGQMYPNDEVFRDLVVTQVKGYVNTIVAGQEGISKQAHAVLMKAATGTPGGPKPLTLDELLATDEARQQWALTDEPGQRGILALLDHNARPVPVRSNQAVVDDAFKRIHGPADDPNTIRNPGQLAPLFAHGLNRADYDWLKKEIDEKQTPEGQKLSQTRKETIDSFKTQFDKSTMIMVDPKGGEQFNKFRQYVMEKERKARDEGKDPYQLYNVNSKDYIGNDVPAFQRTLQAQVADMAAAVRGPAPDTATGTITPAPAGPRPATPAAAVQIREGQTATGPNNEKIVFRGGKWQTMQ